MKTLVSITLSAAILTSALIAGEQFAMSDKDRAMYAELLEANPADIMVAHGEELFEEIGSDAALAKFLDVSEDDLPKYIAGFPRYVEKLKIVSGLGQVIQALQASQGLKPSKLDSHDSADMLAYVKSLANDEKINIDINANSHMKAAYALGKEVFETKRGGRGLACLSCHSTDIVGGVLRTQPLPDLGSVKAAATWPAYRMTKSKMFTLQGRMQQCMHAALLAKIPKGSKEMVALEVYVTTMSQGKTIQIPGLKR